MADLPTYVTTKIASAIGGLFGGFMLMTFIKPKTINESFTRGAVSTGSAIIFADPVLQITNAPQNWELQIMSGAVIGFVAYSVLGAVARFFDRNADSDIVDMVNQVKGKEPTRKK